MGVSWFYVLCGTVLLDKTTAALLKLYFFL